MCLASSPYFSSSVFCKKTNVFIGNNIAGTFQTKISPFSVHFTLPLPDIFLRRRLCAIFCFSIFITFFYLSLFLFFPCLIRRQILKVQRLVDAPFLIGL